MVTVSPVDAVRWYPMLGTLRTLRIILRRRADPRTRHRAIVTPTMCRWSLGMA